MTIASIKATAIRVHWQKPLSLLKKAEPELGFGVRGSSYWALVRDLDQSIMINCIYTLSTLIYIYA